MSKSAMLTAVARNPLLISTEDDVEMVVAAIREIEGNEKLKAAREEDAAREAANDNDFWGNPFDRNDYRAVFRPYVVKDGVLHIPINGMLLDKFPWAFSWATGYQYIEKALARGMADYSVKAIALIVDSGGGEVAGCAECAEKIFAARTEKPIRAFAANHAYSAAYWLASAASEIVVARSGGVGSIGVVRTHVSRQKMLEDAGLEVTMIYAGEHKIDGNPYKGLTEAAKERMQARVDKIYGEFVGDVAKHRNLEESSIRATKALTYDAEEAISVKLADRIGAIEDELIIYGKEVDQDGDEQMTNTQPQTTGQKPGTVDQATHEAAVNAARAEGQQAGHAAAMERINGILGCAEAAKRQTAATHLALKTSISLDEAKAFLAVAPEEAAATAPQQPQQPQSKRNVGDKGNGAQHSFATHMNNTPDVGAQKSDDDEDDATDKAASPPVLGAVMDMAYGVDRTKTKA